MIDDTKILDLKLPQSGMLMNKLATDKWILSQHVCLIYYFVDDSVGGDW